MLHTCSTVATVRRFSSPPSTVCLPRANVSYQSTHGVTSEYVYVYVCFREACGKEGVSDGQVHFRIILCCQRTSIWQCQRASWEGAGRMCWKLGDVGPGSFMRFHQRSDKRMWEPTPPRQPIYIPYICIYIHIQYCAKALMLSKEKK